jgi:HlyD family secretion protein
LKKFAILFSIAALAAAAWFYSRKPNLPVVPFAKVVREMLVSALPATGKVEPIEWSAVRAESPGILDHLSVQQGQSIAKGAVLATLRFTGAQPDLSAAEAQIAKAQAQLADIERGGHNASLAEIENGLQLARFQKRAAQNDLDALIRLEKKNAATRAEVLVARNKVSEAQIEIDALTRKRAALVGASDRSVAEALLKEGQAAATIARRRMAQLEIRSPLSGIVYDLPVRQGAYVNSGDLVANVGRLDKLRVRVYVDEPELGRIAAGQPVTITWDALPGVTWSGVVDKVPTEIVPLGTRQVGEVLCTIDAEPNRERGAPLAPNAKVDPQPKRQRGDPLAPTANINPKRQRGGPLTPGANVDAQIRTGVAPNALTIPKEAVRREGADTGVLLLAGDRVTWRKIATGVNSTTRTQVISGLSEGDSIALPIEQPLKDGDLVKPVYP